MQRLRRLHPRPIAAALVASAVLVGLTSCTGLPAPGETPARLTAVSTPVPTERDGDTDDTDSKAFKARNAHQETLERFDAWVRAQPGVYEHGYIASVADPDRTSMTFLWFGTDPWRNRLVAAGRRVGVSAVAFQQRSQSLASFRATQRRMSAARAEFEAIGFTTFSISGITAEPQPLTMEGRFARGADRAAVRRLASRTAGEPVVVKSGGGLF